MITVYDIFLVPVKYTLAYHAPTGSTCIMCFDTILHFYQCNKQCTAQKLHDNSIHETLENVTFCYKNCCAFPEWNLAHTFINEM